MVICEMDVGKSNKKALRICAARSRRLSEEVNLFVTIDTITDPFVAVTIVQS